MVTTVLPEISLPIIVGGALVDAVNPCLIGVLLLLITILFKTKQRRKILTYGITYTIGVYITYLVGGLTLLGIFNAVREVTIVSNILYGIIGSFVMLAGFLEVKDFYWYGRWLSLSIPKRFVSMVETKAQSIHTNYGAALFLGFIITLIELPCTGAPYLAVLTIISQNRVDFGLAFFYLLLYNLIFVLPLIAIIYLGYTGLGLKRMEAWRQEHRGKMRLIIGVFLLILGIWIITTVYDVLIPLTIFTISLIISMAIVQRYFYK